MMDPKTLDKPTREFLEEIEKSNPPPLYTLPIDDARKVLEDLQRENKKGFSDLKVEKKEIPYGSGNKVYLTLIRPNVEKALPALLYFHGGGWILGSEHTHSRLVKEIAVQVPATVIFVNYTPSPEAKFPTAIDEGLAAATYVSEHPSEFGIDPEKIGIAGDSAGGNLAAAITFLAKQKGPKLKVQALLYPVTDANLDTASYQKFEEGPWLTKKNMEWFWNAYQPDTTERKNPLASPLRADIEQLKNFPPALIITAENDVLRDEGEAYAHKLMQAGVEVAAVRYLGAIHDFMMLNALAETPSVINALELMTSYLRKQFQ